jgi:hypothetical protein
MGENSPNLVTLVETEFDKTGDLLRHDVQKRASGLLAGQRDGVVRHRLRDAGRASVVVAVVAQSGGRGLRLQSPVLKTRSGTLKGLPIASHLHSIHFFGKKMDSKTVTVTAPVNSLEAFFIPVVWQGERECTSGRDLTMH